MNIEEYKTALKNAIDNATDETLLKKWHSQIEKDTSKTDSSGPDTTGWDRVELGLGIDE